MNLQRGPFFFPDPNSGRANVRRGVAGAPSAARQADHSGGGLRGGDCGFGHGGGRGCDGDGVFVGVDHGVVCRVGRKRWGVVLMAVVVFLSVGLDEAPAAFVFGGRFWGGGGGLVGRVGLFEAQDGAEPFGGFAHFLGCSEKCLRG